VSLGALPLDAVFDSFLVERAPVIDHLSAERDLVRGHEGRPGGGSFWPDGGGSGR